MRTQDAKFIELGMSLLITGLLIEFMYKFSHAKYPSYNIE
uniref:Uncharacterized protein n=1 Tax=Rhizophora mucronata TaxID=61149 RepID=A0A2P2PAY3_RHIMU